MLAKTPRPICLECGLAHGEPGFAHDHGDIDNGPAYWSDRGLLCSAPCALEHVRKRTAEGTMPKGPIDCPVDVFGF
jgi:hypothetical protein